MFARIATAVVLVLLCGSYAQAGLMVRGLSEAGQLVESRPASSVPTDQSPSQEDDERYESNLQSPGSDFGGVIPPSPGNSGANAALAERASLPRLTGLQWQVSIGNSSLPPVPLLDGLLKPS